MAYSEDASGGVLLPKRAHGMREAGTAPSYRTRHSSLTSARSVASKSPPCSFNARSAADLDMESSCATTLTSSLSTFTPAPAAALRAIHAVDRHEQCERCTIGAAMPRSTYFPDGAEEVSALTACANAPRASERPPADRAPRSGRTYLLRLVGVHIGLLHKVCYAVELSVLLLSGRHPRGLYGGSHVAAGS